MHNNFSRRGFTLIELLVVIAIIGLLSSIVFASLTTARLKSKDATLKSEVAQLRKLLDFTHDDTGSYATMQYNVGLLIPCRAPPFLQVQT